MYCRYDGKSVYNNLLSFEIFRHILKSKLTTNTSKASLCSTCHDNARQKDGWSHNWLTFEQLIKFDRSVMTYKIINRQCPESLWDKYHPRTQLSNHITRNCRDLQIPRNNLEYVKKGFHYSALKAWNDIPIGIRELPTLSRFKNQLKFYFKSWKKTKTRLPGRAAASK